MPGVKSVRIQVALVLGLFLGSVVVLLFNAFAGLGLPRRELSLREQMREASGTMAQAAEPLAASLGERSPWPSDDLDRDIRAITERVLAGYPGVEGGFYAAGKQDRFIGFAFPTGPQGPHPSPSRSEPPPLEAPYIRAQAQQSIDLAPGNSVVQVRGVATSRVIVVTQPVGAARPALLVTWLMYRLTRPEDLEHQIRRFWLSLGLALAGISLSLVLTLNLVRTIKRQRAEQDRLRDELRRAEHLAALGRLLAGVAHEVRTPLAGLRSTVQLWERLPQTAQSPDSRAAVIQAVDRLNEIVSRLLYFSRADNAERQPVSVNQVLTETLNLLEAQAASQSVTIERILAQDLPDVSGSSTALRQVFLNLVSNALQAMPKGGRLRCQTRTLPERGGVEVRFADTGPGIAPESWGHLFEPFFTTRPEGTGLGLALCREIVLQHGGQIELETEPGQGAVFRVWLPGLTPEGHLSPRPELGPVG